MTTVVRLLIALTMIVLAFALPSLCYAFAGDEMPGWLEEWLPLASIVLGLAGGIGFVVIEVLLLVQAAS